MGIISMNSETLADLAVLADVFKVDTIEEALSQSAKFARGVLAHRSPDNVIIFQSAILGVPVGVKLP